MRTYSKAVAKAASGEKSPLRAQQAWLYLIGAARNRRTIRYEELAELMGYPDPRPVTSALAAVMYYCDAKGLPPLTVLVVNKTGRPGVGCLTLAPHLNSDQQREDIFALDWYDVRVPTVAALTKALTEANEAFAKETA